MEDGVLDARDIEVEELLASKCQDIFVRKDLNLCNT